LNAGEKVMGSKNLTEAISLIREFVNEIQKN
jgi:hypothetical protein